MLRLHVLTPSAMSLGCAVSVCSSLTTSANLGRLRGSAAMHLEVTCPALVKMLHTSAIDAAIGMQAKRHPTHK